MINKAQIEDTRNGDYYPDEFWHDFIDEDFETILTILGYYDTNTYFSGFSSQGDGACFSAKYSYEKGSVKAIEDYAPQDDELYRIAVELQQVQRKCKYDLGSTITTSGRYYHEMTMSCDNWSNRDLVSEDVVDNYTDEVLQLHRDLAVWYYKKLNEQYDYLMSDEAVIDFIEERQSEC